MKVQLDRTFPVPAGADAAWGLLQDIEAVAQCMPGASITERIDDRHFKGAVSVRFGPVTMSFRGELEVREIDPAARTLRLLGKGTDTTGTSGASMDLAARIEAAADASSLVGSSEVSVSGKAAAFGGRMLTTVADQVLKQFAANLAARAAALAAPPGASAAGPGAADTTASPGSGAGTSRELNALALIWAVFKDWLRSLFGRRTA